MERQSNSVILYGFALITVLYFIPSCLAARQLLDFPPPNNPVGEDQDHKHDNQSKSGIHSSEPDRAGSATGDTPPSGVVNGPPPPPPYQRNNTGYQEETVQTSSSNGNCQVVKTVYSNGNKRTVVTGCNNNGNEEEQDNVEQYYPPPPEEYVGYNYP